MEASPFQLPARTPFRLFERFAEQLTGLSRLDAYYRAQPADLDTAEFLRYTLDVLGIDAHIASGSVGNLPEKGPLVIIANHPLGAADGVILAELILKVRPDLKILANRFLARIKELAPLFIDVDVFSPSGKTNLKATRAALNHLKQGGVLLLFPAGEVSSYDAEGTLTDCAWHRSVSRLIRKSQADVLPIFIQGQNSKPFYWAGKIHPRLRTVLLGRELLNKRAQHIRLAIGQPIPFRELSHMTTDQQTLDYLRLNTYLLAPGAPHHAPVLTNAEPIDPPTDPRLLQTELSLLDDECHLIRFKQFDVYCTDAPSIPHLLQEIGRIRETNFRQVNEGTGKSCDLDNYDANYQHLFVWDREENRLVGAYRLGLTDQILASSGVTGLYSNSLFHYDESLIHQFGHAIELGRSVIDAPYQRDLHALQLLWKGIATYVSRHPHYTHLFGPVSISSEYSPLARQLIISTLQEHHFDHDAAKLVRAKTPPGQHNRSLWRPDMLSALANTQLLSKLLIRLGQASVPILLKQYLNLNGKLISFNLDKDFNDALDGLIVVHLPQVPQRTLAKYMGKPEAAQYLHKHQP
ncbi:lysophospholipid acyltransferase family protein [Photobacterium sp. 1_MG-2023]|uniref:lysophospholipid acyltransferase family protein n=1 Tax=Photobacterium sp. 1_MG-2023 TaxID=3062646 RepID=UPI0026E24F2E|nr:GNAT family N-acyltransferase [Photobacterium sp. 1_MG-2023]MDO6708846.1 GNAT family N-acyltransferase [Photobacterium sp. 1_MG-2023]